MEIIRRGSFTSVAQLRAAILEYIEMHNKNASPFRWTATPEKIFEKIEKYCSKLA